MAENNLEIKEIIGRGHEQRLLGDYLQSAEPELIAVYGRRRIGKTFLIRQFYRKEIVFEFSGQIDTDQKTQLANFNTKLDIATKAKNESIPPKDWREAFDRLKAYLEPIINKRKAVVFLDEFPWIDSQKSNFLASFDYFWNDWASKKSNLKIVICGSAASWMIRKVINNKGGLHNRVTRKIRLLPFTLFETEKYLKSKNIVLDRYQIVQLYMAFGGVPHYLKEVKKGKSTSQTIDSVCFTKDGLLYNEFRSLYSSLFKQHDVHIKIVRFLATKNIGYTRKEIIENIKLNSGGGASQFIEELEESGFIKGYKPFGKNKRDIIYKLTDEYSLFYLKFIEKKGIKQAWDALLESSNWRAWAGFAFESVCQKHSAEIKKALGISGIYTELSAWKYAGNSEEKGIQIDLIINRNDNCINICEMKFSGNEFLIDTKYSNALQNRLSIFKEKTKTKKSLFFTAISTYGVKMNEYKLRWVQSEVKMNDLFIEK